MFVDSKNARLGFWISLVSIIGAFVVHVYLTNLHYDLKLGRGEVPSVCSISSTINCENSLASRYAEVQGVPLAILGAVCQMVLLFLLFNNRWNLLGDKHLKSSAVALIGLSAFSFLTSIALAIVSGTLLKSWCPMCFTAYVFSLLTVFGVWVFIRPKENLNSADWTAAAKFLVVVFLGIPITAMAAHKVIFTNLGGEEWRKIINVQVDEWKTQTPLAGEPFSPIVLGAESAQAKMTIIEFADFRCVHCKMAAPQLKSFLKNHPQVRLEFQAFPLDGECNPEIPYKEGVRCYLAQVAMCLNDQKKGPETIAWIFENQEKFTDMESARKVMAQYVIEVGADLGRLNSCSESPGTKDLVKNQAALGHQWGVQGTPSLFIQHKKFSGAPTPDGLGAILEFIENGN